MRIDESKKESKQFFKSIIKTNIINKTKEIIKIITQRNTTSQQK